MRLFDRVSLLLKADAHAVVESIEDRALLLKQHVREAKLELDRKRARLEVLRGEGVRLAAELTRVGERMRALDDDVTLALGNQKEDLARFAIKQLLPLRAEKQRLEARTKEVREEEAALTERVVVQERQFEELAARVRAEIAAMPKGGEEEPGCGMPYAVVVSDEEVEIELLRRQQQQKGAL